MWYHIQGSAEVVFVRRPDAVTAVKKYNNVQLDGKPMKIELIGSNAGLPMMPRFNVLANADGRGKRTVVMMYVFLCVFVSC
jgi:THO complex subunit 4